MSGNLRKSLLGCIDKILEAKDSIGANIHDVFLIDRLWSGERVGEGQFEDEETQIKPTPCIKDHSHDVRLMEAGAVKQGDLILKDISRNQYTELDLRTDVVERNRQKLYKIGKHFYTVIHIKENLVTWDLHVRKIRQDETEER